MPTAAVLGAGGKTGQECVKELVNKGYAVKAVVRSPSKYADTFSITSGSGKVDVVAGDVTNPSSLTTALAGCDGGVIFAASGTSYFSAKSVDYQGVVNTVDAMKASNLPGPLVLVSSCLVSPHNRMHPIRVMLNNFRWGLMDQKFKSEEFLRQSNSGIKYTIVRPGGLKDAPQGEKTLVVQQGDTSAGSVARSDVAAVCVAALTNPAADKVTLELMSESAAVETPNASNGDGQVKVVVPLVDQLKNMFSGLKKD